MREKVEFESQGETLRGTLERPKENPRGYALFAHCFTCGKDIAAAARIARALVQHGIAVLRFDFTGLGNSDGDFANTNFSSNIQDLISAVDFLRQHHQAPALLIGHSLGGAAVLAMADQVPEAKAVVTIGAPHQADHVIHNFAASVDEIEQQGQAEVTLGVRTFTIKKQFLDDLAAHSDEQLGQMKKAVMILHSPIDSTVDISDAEKIYRALKHPKSFVSLDQADHLLSRQEYSEFVANTVAGWFSRYLQPNDQRGEQKVPEGHLMVTEADHRFMLNLETDHHLWHADEPVKMGGQNTGPDPYEHLLAALGACTVMTIRMYANLKKIPLDDIKVHLHHSHHYLEDCEQCEKKNTKVEQLHREIELIGELSNDQRDRLLHIADRCPVHKTLHGEIEVVTREV